MDSDDLFNVLTASSAAAKKESPFAGLSSFAGDFGDVVLKETLKGGAKTKTKDAIIAGLLTGLTQGVSENLTNRYVAEQDELAKNLLMGTMEGGSFERPSGMSPSVFSALDNAGGLFAREQKAAQAGEARKLSAQIAASRFGNPLYEPIGGAGGSNTVKTGFGPEGEVTVDFGTPSTSTDSGELIRAAIGKARLGEGLTPEENVAVSSASPTIQRLYNDAASQAAISSRFNIREGMDLSKDISKSLPATEFQTASASWESLNSLKDQNTQSAAIGMLKSAAKIMNPGAVISDRTLEIFTENPNNYTQQLQDMLNEVKGQGQLSPQHKQELIDAVRPFVEAKAGEYKTFVESQLGTFGSFGGKTGNIKTLPVPDFGASPKETAPESQPVGAPPPGMKAQRNKKTGEVRFVPK